MQPRLIDKDKKYNLYGFLETLPKRHYYALGRTPLPKAPLAYKVGRLSQCINSWMDTDPFMVASLWTEYILVVASLIDINTFPSVPSKEELDSARQEHIKQLKKVPPGSLIDTPLALKLEAFGPIVHRFYLECLGCDVPDVQQSFYSGLWDLYLYLLLETRELVRSRYRSVFNRQLKLVPSFEL